MDCAFHEFFETSRISNAIIDKNGRFKKNEIITYCLEKNINVEKEKKRLFDLCVKHGVNYFGSDWNINFDVDKTISVKPSYTSMFIFSFKQKENNSVFSISYLKKTIMEAVFEKIYSVCTELCKMQEFCLFRENVRKISNCTANNCESEKFVKELSKNVFNEEFSYDERRKFFVQHSMENIRVLMKCLIFSLREKRMLKK